MGTKQGAVQTKVLVRRFMLMGVCAVGLATLAPAPAFSQALDRRVLPIAEPKWEPITTLDARDAKAPPRFQVTAPEKAPNVVIVLLDDMGFGQPDAFGGPIAMPVLDRLAREGVRFNRFHTTALCSPSRVALLTGHNHHANNAGAIMELSTGFPGNTGIRPQTITPMAEILRQNGYSTAAFGKYHETPPWEVSVSGPQDRWPTRSGFDKFYGFIGGETNQWAPAVYDGTVRVEHAKGKDYHFTADMTDQAIAWVSAQQTMTPDKPFMIYFAPGATHAPHHVPAEWIAREKGRYAIGWDKLREETFARQKAAGIVPRDAKLTPRPAEIPAWDSMSAAQKQILERQMETFAAFAKHTDHHIGRLVSQLEALGELDNTLFIYIAGDNGASAEGGPEGTINEMMALNGIAGRAEQMLPSIDRWGDPSTYPHYAIGWAWAGNTPFQWTKQVASHFGGTRNGVAIRWPQGFRAKGEIRPQFHHIIDIAPTVLEAAGLPQPARVNGVDQRPMDGVSMRYALDDGKAADRRRTQYFEMFGNRAIYHEGWVAATRHSIPWDQMTPLPALSDDRWELYQVDRDFAQANDLAASNPAKLKELQQVFDTEARANNVYPLDDRRSERFNARIAGRPDLIGGRKSLTVYPGMTGMMENAFIGVKGVSHSVTADIEVGASPVKGVILAQAGRFGGWSLFTHEGKPTYEYNWFGLERTRLAGTEALPPGKHVIRFEFTPDSPKPAAGGISALFVNGTKVAEARIPKTIPFAFSGDEGADVGVDNETPVSELYGDKDNGFTGVIRKVVVEVK
jgi:arylsulfatase A-like enzyme